MRINKLYLYVIWFLIIGCKEKSETPVVGDLIGFIDKRDEFGFYIRNEDPVQVEIVDGEKHFSTKASAVGKFHFRNIPQGTYNFIFSAEGYGTTRVYSLSHVGGNNPTDLNRTGIKQFSTTHIQYFSIAENGTMTGTIYPVPEEKFNYRSIMFLLDTKETVCDTSYLTSISTRIQPDNTFSESIDNSYYEFKKGDTIYIKAYGNSGNGGYYFNPNTGEYIYTSFNLNPTATLKYIKN